MPTHTPHTTPQPSHENANASAVPVLRRTKWYNYRARPIFWHTPGIPNLLEGQPTSGLVDLDRYGDSLNGVLAYVSRFCHLNRENEAIVYLAGGQDAASTMDADYYRDPLQDGWRIVSWRTGPMAVTYETLNTATSTPEHPQYLHVHVRVAAAWFDDAHDADLLDLAAGYSGVQEHLRMRFDGAYLLGTPAQTGLDLLEHTLPFNLELPALPAELREKIQHNSPQGRNEVLTAPDGPNASLEGFDHLQCYDAKWMYASCVNHVPAGHYEQYSGDFANTVFRLEPYNVGFYRVFATIPDNWHHIGLLPTWEPEEQRTLYPWQPGTVFESWCTGAELHLAIENGWRCYVEEAIVWPDAMKLNPLKTWRDGLISVRDHAEQRGNGLVATAIRHILIDALGAMARRNTPEHHITPYDQIKTIPAGAYNRDLQEWGIEWDMDRTLSGWSARFQHPEIPAMVWGRARARLARFALQYPVEWFILARTDAWWTDRLIPGIPLVATKPGEWRPKESLSAPFIPAPRDTSQALTLIRAARASGKVA